MISLAEVGDFVAWELDFFLLAIREAILVFKLSQLSQPVLTSFGSLSKGIAIPETVPGRFDLLDAFLDEDFGIGNEVRTLQRLSLALSRLALARLNKIIHLSTQIRQAPLIFRRISQKSLPQRCTVAHPRLSEIHLKL